MLIANINLSLNCTKPLLLQLKNYFPSITKVKCTRVQSFEEMTTYFDPVELEEIRKVDEEDQQGGRDPDIPFQHRHFSRCHARSVSLSRLSYPDRYTLRFLTPLACAREINGSVQSKNDGEKR